MPAFDLGDQRLGDLVAGLGVDLAGLLVDDVDGEIAADQIVLGDEDLLEAFLGEFPRLARRHLLAGLGLDLAGLGVDEVVRSA